MVGSIFHQGHYFQTVPNKYVRKQHSTYNIKKYIKHLACIIATKNNNNMYLAIKLKKRVKGK